MYSLTQLRWKIPTESLLKLNFLETFVDIRRTDRTNRSQEPYNHKRKRSFVLCQHEAEEAGEKVSKYQVMERSKKNIRR